MPVLLIKRNSEWANKYRSFDLYINDVKFTEIRDKQVLKFELPEGDYKLVAKLGRCGSKPIIFTLEKGDIKRVEIKGFLFSKYLLPLGIVVALLYFALYLKLHHNNLFLATIMMFLLGYLVYFVSFGRDQFLRIKEF